ncbi:hypothetical protein ACVSL0_28280 [Pseudomonas aeruginosa]
MLFKIVVHWFSLPADVRIRSRRNTQSGYRGSERKIAELRLKIAEGMSGKLCENEDIGQRVQNAYDFAWIKNNFALLQLGCSRAIQHFRV